MPRISRYPAALTPVAIRQCTFPVRPPSRTFQFSASIQQNVSRPPSGGRDRDPSASSSSSADRSFGIASSIVPARVSRSRRRYPLREFTRPGVNLPVARVAADRQTSHFSTVMA